MFLHCRDPGSCARLPMEFALPKKLQHAQNMPSRRCQFLSVVFLSVGVGFLLPVFLMFFLFDLSFVGVVFLMSVSFRRRISNASASGVVDRSGWTTQTQVVQGQIPKLLGVGRLLMGSEGSVSFDADNYALDGKFSVVKLSWASKAFATASREWSIAEELFNSDGSPLMSLMHSSELAEEAVKASLVDAVAKHRHSGSQPGLTQSSSMIRS